MGERSRSALVRALAGLTSGLLVAGVLGLAVPATARADSAPAVPSPTNPPTVSADALPTVQVNGVVWSQVVVGTTVYAAGNFTRARPAGAAPGTQETVRNRLLAYDIRTGELISSFAPDLDAQALVVAASPDGTRLYVGGNFTRANGQVRNRIAAYDTRTGALVPGFAPSVNAQVRAIAATNSTVYFGGSLTAVGSVSRTSLAAVRASDGSLLPWAPVPGPGPSGYPYNRDGNTATSVAATSLVVTGGGAQVVASGRWDTMDGVRATAITALDPVTGRNRGYVMNTMIMNQGVNSAVYNLSTDGTNVYGTAYDYYGPGNLEGSFSVRAADGAPNWVNDCAGDTYASFAMNGALYHAAHPHHCGGIGGFPEQSPRTNRFATAVSLARASDSGAGRRLYEGSWRGTPAPALLAWFPDMAPGTFTGQGQAGWTVTGNGTYLVYGGEFPTVNGVGQQGLVRFAVPAAAPNKVGPRASGRDLTPALTSPVAGTVRVAWRATADHDNETLTYRVTRSDRPGTPVHETTAASTWWDRPALGFVDRDVVAGKAYTYRVTAVDPFGNAVSGSSATITVATETPAGTPYAGTVLADSPQHYWRLDEAAGSLRSVDQAGFNDLLLGKDVALGGTGALAGKPGTSATLNGTQTSAGAAPTRSAGPDTVSMEAWFSTRSTTGGVLMDFGAIETGITGGDRDRMISLDGSGRVVFTVWPGKVVSVTGNRGYNDGAWHHVVATLGPTGMNLYLDGKLAASRTDTKAGENFRGVWRIGGDARYVGSADWFNGRIDEVAVYGSQLTTTQVQRHWSVGRTGTGPNTAPEPSFTTTVTELEAAFDGRGSVDRDGGITGYRWEFGDGTTGTGATVTRRYAAAGTYPVRLTVTDSNGATASVTRNVTVTGPPPNVAPTADFAVAGSGLTAFADASSSSDADGTITRYAWEFGDGATASGPTASHTYAVEGTYPVTLTVTDDDGATSSTRRTVSVPAPGLVADAFGRTVASGFGQADVGGAWASVGAASVSDGAGRLQLGVGKSSSAYLTGVAIADVATQVAVSMDAMPTGGGAYVYLAGRRVEAADYRASVKVTATGKVVLGLSRLQSGVETKLTAVELAGVTYTPGAVLLVRLDVAGTGTTVLNAKAWLAGTAEPAGWQTTAGDTTAALQTAGGVGVAAFLSGSATAPLQVRVDDLWAGPAGTAPEAHPAG